MYFTFDAERFTWDFSCSRVERNQFVRYEWRTVAKRKRTKRRFNAILFGAKKNQMKRFMQKSHLRYSIYFWQYIINSIRNFFVRNFISLFIYNFAVCSNLLISHTQQLLIMIIIIIWYIDCKVFNTVPLFILILYPPSRCWTIVSFMSSLDNDCLAWIQLVRAIY